jgi:hypothetical protein
MGLWLTSEIPNKQGFAGACLHTVTTVLKAQGAVITLGFRASKPVDDSACQQTDLDTFPC